MMLLFKKATNRIDEVGLGGVKNNLQWDGNVDSRTRYENFRYGSINFSKFYVFDIWKNCRRYTKYNNNVTTYIQKKNFLSSFELFFKRNL